MANNMSHVGTSRQSADQRTFSISSGILFLSLRCLAFIISLISIKLLTNPRLRGPVYKFLLAMSISDSIYTGSMVMLAIMSIACGNNSSRCGQEAHFSLVLLYLIISEYLTSSLAFFNILVEIFLSIERLLLISGVKNLLDKSKTLLMSSILLIVSLLVYSPILFMNYVKDVKVPLASNHSTNQTTSFRTDYAPMKTEFGRSSLAMSIITALTLIRILLATLVLIILNSAVIIVLRFYFNKAVKRERGNSFTF